ncbi:MAG: hypothetical protein ACYCPQ_04760 [Elusimicrobiota bacterium]
MPRLKKDLASRIFCGAVLAIYVFAAIPAQLNPTLRPAAPPIPVKLCLHSPKSMTGAPLSSRCQRRAPRQKNHRHHHRHKLSVVISAFIGRIGFLECSLPLDSSRIRNLFSRFTERPPSFPA